MVLIPDGFVAPPVPELDDAERELDVDIVAALPKGHKILSIAVHGASYWALSHKIEVILANGTKKAYFLKVMTNALGKSMAQGEFESLASLYAIIPANTPAPISHGTYAKDADRHFFLCDFHDMGEEMKTDNSTIEKFVSVVAKLHQDSISPTGKFGFHCTVYYGNHPVQTTWCESWEEFFVRQFREEVEWEKRIQGQDDELDELVEAIFGKVIPRLLRPLQMGGGAIKPSLCHGDLWHGNVGLDEGTGEPIIYDPGAVYAHNEWDMTAWRASRYMFNDKHRAAYRELVKPSEPVEDFDDRNALYALRNNITVSAQWPDNRDTRQLAMQEMRRLVAKYPDGIDGFKE